MNSLLERLFKLQKHQTTVRTEALAGLTTFFTMAYILAVNPAMLAVTGMDQGAVFTATALAAAIGSLCMGLLANLPIGLASGMGLNAFFAYTVVGVMGYTWQMALAAVFIEGVLFILLTLFNVRKAIVDAIPMSLKQGISVGIGLFITLIGLVGSGLITPGGAFSQLGDLKLPSVWLSVVSVVIITLLLIKRVRGALLLGILIVTLAGIPFGVTQVPDNFRFLAAPPSVAPVFAHFDFSEIWSLKMLVVVITFIFMDLFDTAGTLIAVCSRSGLMDKKGNIPRVKQAFMSDALATTAGAVLGTSTVTAFVESTAGVAEGGKTGLTAVFVALMFFLSLFFAPLFALIPTTIVSSALIVVGVFMIGMVVEIDFSDYRNSMPAFIAMVITPLSYSIADGIMAGVISYVVINLLSRKTVKSDIPLIVMAIIFLLKIIFV